jgi:ATP-dependent exoDNAse (exonuclease V) alpha subunit
MVSEYFYKHLMIVKQLKPNIKFILSGDFEQLPVVNDRIAEGFDYKNSMALYELCEGNRINLTTCFRADKDFFDLIHPKNIKNVNSKMFSNKFTERHISFTNDKRIQINKIMMDKKFEPFKDYKKLIDTREILKKQKKSMKHINELIAEFKDTSGEYIELPKKINDASSQDVILMKGTPIIAKVNKLSKKDIESNCAFVNNEEFLITKIDGDNIHISDIFIVHKNDFQNYFNVSYCITTHKSQGQTYAFEYTIHEWHRFSDCMKYVALSRATNIKYINII